MALIYNATFDSQTRILSLLDKAGNVISSCEVSSKEVDDPNKPLMLRAIEDNSSVTLAKKGTLSNTYQTSTNGTDWTDYTLGTKITLNNGDSVYFRCSNHPSRQSNRNYVQFVMEGKIEAWHNAYSMINSDFSSANGRVGDSGMYSLFRSCSSLTKAPLLLNTVDNSAYYCYESMFEGCTSLVQAPDLPSTNLTSNCYQHMFRDCTSLVQAPELPATALASYCYYYMFYGCTSLVQAPELPATTLSTHCYYSMFEGCTSLVQAPELPATTLHEECYRYMFRNCTSLVQAPELPATALVGLCYYGMFSNCTSLNEVRIAATTKAPNTLNFWLENVAATGDFYCDQNATIFPTNSSDGIPANWTRHALADYPVTP